MSVYDRAERNFSFQGLVGTDENVGPGAYEWGAVPRSRVRSDGYAPFNSLASRDNCMIPGDSVVCAPGPGQYDPTVPYNPRKGGNIGKGNRFTAFKSDTPGPAQYTLSSKWLKGDPRFSSADPSKDKQGQMMVNSRIRYQRKADAPSIPIPAQAYGYEERDDGSLLKQDPPKRDSSIGPAFYKPVIEENNVTQKYRGCHWGKDQMNRTTFLGSDGPGPGEYEVIGDSEANNIVHMNLRDSKLHELQIPRFMDKVEKDAIKSRVPGPGTYEFKAVFDNQSLQFNEEGNAIDHPPFGVQAKRFNMRSVEIPGPGAYNDPRHAFNSLKRVTGMKRSPFGLTAVRFNGNTERQPVDTTKPYQSDTFRKQQKPGKKVGPGTYNTVTGVASESMRQAYLSSMRKGAFGTTAVRLKPMAKVTDPDTPGPGHYQVTKQDKPVRTKYNQPLSSMFASLTNRDFNPSDIQEKPPPDSYNVVESYALSQGQRRPQPARNEDARRRNESFGCSSKRFGPRGGFALGDPEVPGPAAYSTEGKLNDNGGKFITKEERFQVKLNDMPGPGHYELHPTVANTLNKRTHNATLGTGVEVEKRQQSMMSGGINF